MYPHVVPYSYYVSKSAELNLNEFSRFFCWIKLADKHDWSIPMFQVFLTHFKSGFYLELWYKHWRWFWMPHHVFSRNFFLVSPPPFGVRLTLLWHQLRYVGSAQWRGGGGVSTTDQSFKIICASGFPPVMGSSLNLSCQPLIIMKTWIWRAPITGGNPTGIFRISCSSVIPWWSLWWPQHQYWIAYKLIQFERLCGLLHICCAPWGITTWRWYLFGLRWDR